MPIQVVAISSWTSPWFQAKPGFTHGFAPHEVEVWKKKSGLPNIVNVGVRAGSALTMCSAFSPTVSANSSPIGTRAPSFTWGSVAVVAARSRSSLRTCGSRRSGCPLT